MDSNQLPTPLKSDTRQYCDRVIIAFLFAIIIAIPLYYDVNIYSVFDLSKITVLYIFTFTILAAWSIKAIISCQRKKSVNSTHLSSESAQKVIDIEHNAWYKTRPLRLPIIALVLASGLSTISSINPYLSLVGTYKRYGGFISTLVYVSLFFVIVNFIDRRRISLLMNVIIFTTGIASVYGILQHFGIDYYRWNMFSGYGTRVFGTFGHPAFFSAFITMTIPLILIKIFSSLNFRYTTFLYIGILALVTVAFYYTRTRASFLGLIISSLFFFSLVGKKNLLANKAKTIVVISILTGISIYFNVNNESSVIARFTGDIRPASLDNNFGNETSSLQDVDLTRQELSPPSVPVDGMVDTDYGLRQHSPKLSPDNMRGWNGQASGWYVNLIHRLTGSSKPRALLYLTGLSIIYDYPILGIGPDTLSMIYYQYLSEVCKKTNEYVGTEKQTRMHNAFLDATVSGGLLGLGVYLWFIFAFARMIWIGSKSANETDKILIIGLCAGCLAYFVQNQFSFGHIPIITLFWFLAAMSVVVCSKGYSSSNIVKNQEDLPSNVIHNSTVRNKSINRYLVIAIAGIVVCLMILLVTLSMYRYKADYYFKKGLRLHSNSKINEAIQSFETAVSLNPFALSYQHILNDVYLKMAKIAIIKGRVGSTKNMPGNYTHEQVTSWLTNAINGAEKIQRLYPGDYSSVSTLGQAYYFLDKISEKDMSNEAIKYFKRAIILQPLQFEYRNTLAQLYADKGRYNDAINEINNAKRILPGDPAAYMNLAKIHMRDNKRYGDAEAVLLEFTSKYPDHKIKDIYKLLCDVYFKTAKWEKALSQLEKVIKIDQEDLETYKFAIVANIKLKRYDNVRKLCNRIL
ncbi:MAG: O-antigen ligase family protein, partial [Candidatus Brocadiales bacterium]|nr:O-antigen ligase family protein [Candidatus Brocadiales bacterium]